MTYNKTIERKILLSWKQIIIEQETWHYTDGGGNTGLPHGSQSTGTSNLRIKSLTSMGTELGPNPGRAGCLGDLEDREKESSHDSDL